MADQYGEPSTAERYKMYCPHCGAMRDEAECSADPYINAEPATYCRIAALYKAATSSDMGREQPGQ